ncbi:hypothetical protein M011DRAFT_128068 [Sporormia fimetaria CBS 119925]|uniref:Transmembrane protein n=1 Tax=Sporormia fimetaria CBS 119925 TaxID=1340428 RepID=A0A6A6V628_9PLEO|nr:hypothetical protein M011DRAFT_128068 [Sporormia fimetaria CBS 119925]
MHHGPGLRQDALSLQRLFLHPVLERTRLLGEGTRTRFRFFHRLAVFLSCPSPHTICFMMFASSPLGPPLFRSQIIGPRLGLVLYRFISLSVLWLYAYVQRSLPAPPAPLIPLTSEHMHDKRLTTAQRPSSGSFSASDSPATMKGQVRDRYSNSVACCRPWHSSVAV